MSISLKKGQFTTIGPDEIWKIYNNLHGIFRGGGNRKAPKIVRADGPRKKDLDIRINPDTGLEMVYPNPTKGLSFADSIETLARKKLEGQVWVIPKGRRIPGDLYYSYMIFSLKKPV